MRFENIKVPVDGEKTMNLLTKAAVSLAATSMIAAPVAASAATAFDGARSTSAVTKKNGLEGGSSWIIAILAIAAIIGGIIIAADNDSHTRTEEHPYELQSLMRISYAVL